MNSYRFERQFVQVLPNDAAAFEEADGYYDERPAIIEKFLNDDWCEHSDPIYHPQHYRGQLNGGWMNENGTLVQESVN